MKCKNLLVLAVLGIATVETTSAQQVFFSEDFESQVTGQLPAGWSQELGDNALIFKTAEAMNVHDEDNGDWQSAAIQGKKTLFSVQNWSDGAGGPVEVMCYTPLIDLTKATEASLSYKELRAWDNYWPGDKPNHSTFVMVKEEGASQWTVVKEVVYNQTNFKNWQSVDVKLDAYAGKKVYVGFKSDTHHYFWRIDAMEISGTATSVKELNTEAMSLYPNPANQMVQLSGVSQLGKGIVLVYNVTGQCVMQMSVEFNNGMSIDVSTLNSGIYYLKAASHEGSLIQKLTIE